MYSIRKKLNLYIIVGMIVVLSLTTVFLYLLIARQVEKAFDTSLLDKAHALISITELDQEDGMEFDFTEGTMPEFEIGADAQYYQVWEHGINLMVKSPSLKTENLPRFKTELGQHQFSDLTLADGRAGRLIEINFLPRFEADADEEDREESEESDENSNSLTDPDDVAKEIPIPQPMTLVLARERESLDETLLAIGLTISGFILLVLAISGLMIRYFVGRELLPLSNLARQVGLIDESKLDLRLSHAGVQSIEIAPIEEQINHLLARLESAFEREKRFSSNVAHELRTPLAELRTLAEVGNMVPEDREDIVAFFNDVSDISIQMERVVITLLELSRFDAGLLRAEPEDIALNEYCEHIWNQAILGQSLSRRLVNRVSPDLVINTDKEKLGIILSNLFTNALSYSPDNAEILVDINIQNLKVAIQVRNTAIDLKAADIVHMKDRFWRKQKAHGSFGHSGLGLSLVEALAGIMNVNVKFALENDRDFQVEISGFETA